MINKPKKYIIMNRPKKMSKYIMYVLIASIPIIFFSCYPGGIEYYNETDIAVTQYDDSFDFASNKNYFMPDTIFHVGDEGILDNLNRNYDTQILSQIASEMAAAGYTRFESDVIKDSLLIDSANVVLSVVAITVEYTGVGYIPGGGYWWGYYPGWGGYYKKSYWGYDPYYPWYPGYGYGYTYTYSFSTGSIFIEMVDQDGIIPAEEEFPIAWQAVINGLLSEDLANMQWRIDRAITQCFTQSPYLSN